MTTNTPAPAQQDLLTEEEMIACIKDAIRRARDQGLSDAGPHEYVAAGAVALLSKLRAPVADERAAFEEHWRRDMNIEEMDLHRCEFPNVKYEDQPYACHETNRGWMTWQTARTAPVSDKQCEAVYESLSDFGYGVDHYEFGLPSLKEEHGRTPQDKQEIRGWRGTAFRLIRAALASAPVAAKDAALWVQALPGHNDRVSAKRHRDRDNGYVIPLFTLAQVSAPVAGEALTRFCPECGLVGNVASGYRSCCPDGGSARMIPVSLAKKCRDNFLLAINREAAPQASEAVRDALIAFDEAMNLCNDFPELQHHRDALLFAVQKARASLSPTQPTEQGERDA